ncbi:MAG: hypothetical protein WBD11_15290 [Xanthobacteraceae bacterium]
MTTNDLTAPLGQGPRNRRLAVNVPAAQIIAVALGLFLGLFVLWAVVGRDPSGGEPVAVAPADLRIAKKAPELVSVPQAAAPTDSADQAAAGLVSPAPQTKTTNAVTVTIVDARPARSEKSWLWHRYARQSLLMKHGSTKTAS